MSVVLLAALPASAQTAAAPVSIDISNNFFDPENIEINVGATVTWTKQVTRTHTVTQCFDANFSNCSGGFDSDWLEGGVGETYLQTFNTAGIIYYRCNVHPTVMPGRLDVSAAPTATPTTTATTPTPTATPVSETPPAPTATPPAATSTAVLGAAELPTTGGEPAGGSGLPWLALAMGMLIAASAGLAPAYQRRRVR